MIQSDQIEECACHGVKEGVYIEQHPEFGTWRVVCGFCMRSSGNHKLMKKAVEEWNEKHGRNNVAPKISGK